MKLRLYIIIALVATALSAMARAYAPEDLRNVHLDNRTRYVTDPDGVLSPGAVTRLDSMLAHVWRTTTAEPLVVVIDDMAPGYDEVTFANDLFDLWKPGKKDTNNGLILLIVKNPRRYTVRTGYGLEGVLTDGNCGSVMRRYAVQGYFMTYPGVKEYMDNAIASARGQGYVTTLMGRRRMLPDISSRNAVVRGYAERNAINAPLQGSAADIIKIAMVNVARRLEAEQLQTRMIMQVHDELIFDVVPSELERIKELVADCMASAYQGTIPLEVSMGTGANWLEAH